jgi:hypothetical protein
MGSYKRDDGKGFETHSITKGWYRLMHVWGDEDVDWQGINDATAYIGNWLRKWPRIGVTDMKEKYGTVRIYCHFGWYGVYSIWRPHYAWYPKWWPMRLDFWLADSWIFRILNKIAVPLQQKAYAWRYKKAVEKWPHLREEIVSMADYGELFEGVIPGYKHSDYWKTM